ncbi:MAG TPA: sensor histidine kinase [Symbiobacteriaceae bacterium]|nr:sensor histidine kinase [Symbiobacteriaceae bacterium]
MRLANIQWRLTLFGAAVAGLAFAVSTAVILVSLRMSVLTLLGIRWLQIPVLVWVAAFALIAGLLAGYRYGNRLKRRLERLVETTLHFGQGNFGQRAPALGEDEIGLVAGHLNEMAQRVERQVASLQRLSTQQAQWREQERQAAVAEERQRLARELHDAVSQQLFAISMMTSAVLEQVREEDKLLRRQISSIETMAGNAQNEMRALLMHLRPAILAGKGLKEGLEELLAAFRERQSIQVRWEAGDLPPLPKGVEDHLFRIVQEGLSNVLRHAGATAVTVRLHAVNRQVRLKIIDNGSGFDPAQARSTSYGLQSIKERASEIGGVAEVISFPGKGTQVEVKVPVVEDRGEGAV